MKRRVLLFLGAVLFAANLCAQSVIINNPGKKGTFAIRNATIVPVSSAPIANGTLLIANGTITAIGAAVTVPADGVIVDGTGLFVYPGLIDSGSTIGLEEISSVPGTVDVAELGYIKPNARAEVARHPQRKRHPGTRGHGRPRSIALRGINGGLLTSTPTDG